MKNLKYIIGGIFLLVMFLSPKVFAISKHDIVINELMWTGSLVSSADEWIELKNITDSDIDLTGWKLTRLKDGQEIDMIEISSGSIESGGYFLISNSSADHSFTKGESILNIEPDLIDSAVSLTNNNLQIKLYNQNGNLIDTAGNGEKPLAGNNDKKYSMERNDLVVDGTLASSWHTATQRINFDSNREEKGTPRSTNSPSVFSSPSSYPESVSRYITLVDCLEAEVYVTYIVDGDTINVDLNGEDQRIRLLGIDSPESAKSSDFKVDEPYYREAKEFAESELLGKTIKLLVSSDSSEQYDSYDRLLAAIIINNEIFDIDSIKHGLSRAYYLSNPLIISSAWENEEQLAKNNHLGIWEYFGLKSDIIINEFIPNPDGKDSENEWIELYNTSNHSIDLSNWFLDDRDGGSNPYLFPDGTIISPNGYLIIKITDSGIALNNKGDSVRLFNPSISLVEEVVYKEIAKEGWSYNRDNDGNWYWYFDPSPGEKNKSSVGGYDESWPEKPAEVENIAQARKLPNKTYTLVKGQVTVKPGVLSSRYFYIQDDTAAIQIYSYYKQFPELNLGDYIEVYGQLSGKYYRRLKIKNLNWIKILSINNKSPPAKEITSNDVNYDNEGLLVEFIGRVVKLSGQIFYLEDENGKVKISIRKSAGFKRQKMKRGDIIKITGIIYCSKSSCSILPRQIEDIEILYSSKKSKKKKTKKQSKVLASLVGFSQSDSGGSKLANFLLSNVLHNVSNLKDKINLSQKLILVAFYIILITTVLCIILLGEMIWKKNLLPIQQGRPAS